MRVFDLVVGSCSAYCNSRRVGLGQGDLEGEMLDGDCMLGKVADSVAQRREAPVLCRRSVCLTMLGFPSRKFLCVAQRE